MLSSAESLADGTWGGSEAPPDEWLDYILMKQMGWSWRDLTGLDGEVPPYVRRFVLDFMSIMNREAERG